ncbi:MAG: class I SAM-dependent methyltransferase [Candidatus Electrothrix sp. AW5]|nr:class I SAM-dependent methyltransferase [Candidatus Electrothrix gigas]
MTDSTVLLICPICHFQNVYSVLNIYDDRYGYPGLFDLLLCNRCRHKFLSCHFSEEQLENLYTDYYLRSTFDLKVFRPYEERTGFRYWFDGGKSAAHCWVPKNVRVLDIGCGFGHSLAYHTNRGCDVYGVEADRNIKRVAEKFGFKIHVGLFDPDVYQNDFFDYITMHQVLEHFVNPVRALQGVKKILKPKGTAILTMPNANGWGVRFFGKHWVNWHAPYHLHFFSRKSMKMAAERAALTIDKAMTVTSSEWLYYQQIHISVFPEEGVSSVFWDPARKPSEQEQKRINRISKFHRKYKLNYCITRLFDSIGLGDNIVYFLKNEQNS